MKVFKKNKRTRGQGTVEFALALPILLLIVFGMIEFGRMLFVYIVINSAAREAARYGITVGDGTIYHTLHTGEDVVTQRYYDCDGIRAAAMEIGKFAGVKVGQISITYDHGPNITDLSDFPDPPKCYWVRHRIVEHPFHSDMINYGDRIKIYISVPYTPLLSYLYLDIPDFKVRAYVNRTIVRNAKVAPGPAP
jgi:hypothetical protein